MRRDAARAEVARTRLGRLRGVAVTARVLPGVLLGIAFERAVGMEPQNRGIDRYPVALEATQPERFERVQVALRLLVWLGLGVLQQSLGGLFGLLYLLLPIAAGVLVSRRGGAGFIARDAPWLVAFLDWVVGLYAYLMFVSDRFPLDTQERPTRLHVDAHGTPTVGAALVRLLTSLPHALVLALLGLVSGVVAVIAAITIVFSERYPVSLWRFQRDVLAWNARMLAHHASLVATYPPFSLTCDEQTDKSSGQPSPAST